MKQILIFLVALVLLPAALRPQALPDAPAPAPPDPAWDRVRNLNPGQPIVVVEDNNPPVHCLFAAATDAYLFCNPPENPPGVGYRFDRASVVSVDLDLPAQNGAQFEGPQRNWHPGTLAAMAIGGAIVGIGVARNTDAKQGVWMGLAAAGVIGAIATSAPQTNGTFAGRNAGPGSAYRPRSFTHERLPRFGPHPHPPLRLARIR